MRHMLEPGTRVTLADDITPPDPNYVGKVGIVIAPSQCVKDSDSVFVRWPDGSEIEYPRGVIVKRRKTASELSKRLRQSGSGLENEVTALERAFQLARSGAFANITELKKALKREAYNPADTEGRALSEQLRKILSGERERASGLK